MSRRRWMELAARHISFSQVWPGAGIGRYWKRRLSKARRRYWKMACRGLRGVEPAGLESWVNWRTW